MANVLDTLRERGLLEAVTHDGINEVLSNPITLYAGFDPTAPSLGVGNLVTVMTLAHFQRAGHRVIALVGGATGMIGDPSGKAGERQLLDPQTISRNSEGIKENLSRFLDFNNSKAPALMLDNSSWLATMGLIDFLRDIGKVFRMGSMLSRDSVRARLESEAGMSFTEFAYSLLQAYDFLYLHDNYGCILQVGGSDQWGNITAGTELVRKLRGREVFGLTFPLLTDPAGVKFGKSEGNSVYLDKKLTSCYDFYQFFMRQPDSETIKLLKIFTFLDKAEIEELSKSLSLMPEKRDAQKRLAEEVTRMVHGENGLAIAKRASDVLFGGPISGLNADEAMEIFAHVPSCELPLEKIIGKPIVEVAAVSGLCSSRGAARRLIQSGGLYIGDRRVGTADETVAKNDLLEGKLLILRSGKKTFHLVKAC